MEVRNLVMVYGLETTAERSGCTTGGSTAGTAAPELPATVRCLIAACDDLAGETLRRQFRHFRHPRVVAETTPANHLLPAIRSFQPQVLVLQIDHADIDPLAVTKNVRCYHPALPILISTGQRDAMLASRLLRSGAQGYLLLDDWADDGERALSLLAAGACFVSETIMQQILHHLGEFQEDESAGGVDALTDRELIVFQFIGLGHPVQQIARELHVTPRTVATHRNNIKRKMRLGSDADLVASAQNWVSQRNG